MGKMVKDGYWYDVWEVEEASARNRVPDTRSASMLSLGGMSGTWSGT